MSPSFMDWVSRVKGTPSHPAGSSPLEQLPTELLTRIFQFVAAPMSIKGWTPHTLPGDGYSSPNSLLSSLLVSHRFHEIALFIMYRTPNIRRSNELFITGFFDTLSQNPGFRSLVRTFDITRTAPSRFLFTNDHLSHLPQIRDLRLSLSHIKDVKMLHHFLFRIPDLESLTVDVSRLHENVSMLKGAFDSLPAGQCSTIKSLKFTDVSGSGGLHIPGVLESLLPRMSRLRVLDVSRTCVTVDALNSLPETVKLTHLNVWGCLDMDLGDLVTFLTTHPAVKSTLRTLKAGYVADAAPLSERQINTFLGAAPKTLRSLDLSMSNMGPTNIPHLQRLCRTQLRELSVGRGLEMADIEDMLLKPTYDFADEHRESPVQDEATKEEITHEAMLEPMKNTVALCKLRHRLDSVRLVKGRGQAPLSKLRYLNLSSLSAEEQGLVKQSVLLARESGVQVVEVADVPWEEFQVLKRLCPAVGWREMWEGKRIWVERL